LRVIHAAIDEETREVAIELNIPHARAREACLSMAACVQRMARARAERWGRFEARVRATCVADVIDEPCVRQMQKQAEQAAPLLLAVALGLLVRKPLADLSLSFKKFADRHGVVRIDARVRASLPVIFSDGKHEDHVLRYDQILAALSRESSDVVAYTRAHDAEALTAGVVHELLCATNGPLLDLCRDAAQYLALATPALLYSS
jgi:hypothetical protein